MNMNHERSINRINDRREKIFSFARSRSPERRGDPLLGRRRGKSFAKREERYLNFGEELLKKKLPMLATLKGEKCRREVVKFSI